VGFVAAALVVTVLFAGDGTPQPKSRISQLAAVTSMDRQMMVAAAAAPPQAITHKLQEDDAEAAPEAAPEPAPEAKAEADSPAAKTDKDDSGVTAADLIPTKVKGGKGQEVTKSVEEAFSEKSNKNNSHYVGGYSDKEVRTSHAPTRTPSTIPGGWPELCSETELQKVDVETRLGLLAS
jgi:hypothetical protein